MSEPTMIERMARALCRFDGHAEDAVFDGEPRWMSYVDQARVALTALREPTKPLHEAALNLGTGRDPAAYWARMVDEALNEG